MSMYLFIYPAETKCSGRKGGLFRTHNSVKKENAGCGPPYGNYSYSRENQSLVKDLGSR